MVQNWKVSIRAKTINFLVESLKTSDFDFIKNTLDNSLGMNGIATMLTRCVYNFREEKSFSGHLEHNY